MAKNDDHRPILCAVDGTEPAAVALAVAAEVAPLLGTHIELVHAWPGAGSAGQERAARRCLADAKVEVTTPAHLEQGMPVDAILDVADRIDARLIVAGTHARGRWGRFLLGSTADGLIRTSDRPLLIVRPDTVWPPAKIVVGDDGSGAALAALQLAGEISAAYEAPMVLLQALPEIRTLASAEDPRGELAARALNDAVEELQTHANAVMAVTEKRPHLSVRLVPAQRALAETLRPGVPTLVVVGRRDAVHRAEDGGSVSEAVFHTVHAPLLVYPTAAI